jgi:hypothetical protein
VGARFRHRPRAQPVQSQRPGGHGPAQQRGRPAIAQANPDASPEQLATLVEQAVKDGKMVVIDKNDTLVPSNETNPGETRETKNNPWPTDNPGRNDDCDPGQPTAKPDQY